MIRVPAKGTFCAVQGEIHVFLALIPAVHPRPQVVPVVALWALGAEIDRVHMNAANRAVDQKPSFLHFFTRKLLLSVSARSLVWRQEGVMNHTAQPIVSCIFDIQFASMSGPNR